MTCAVYAVQGVGRLASKEAGEMEGVEEIEENRGCGQCYRLG